MGLVPAVFIAWAWWDSGLAMTATSLSSKDGWLMVSQAQGAIIFARNDGFSLLQIDDVSGFRELDAWIERDDPVRNIGLYHFPVAFESELVGDESARTRFTFVAWWSLALTYLFAWIGVAIWRYRRKSD